MTAVIPQKKEKVTTDHVPIDIGDFTLNMRNMCKKRSGLPRSLMSSSGQGNKASNER